MYTGRYLHQSFWNQGLFSSTAEVAEFLQYHLHVEGIVLYFISFFRYIKMRIVICYMGLKFP
jgi:hypothetical protein